MKKYSIQIKIGILMMLAVGLLAATGYLSYRNLSSIVSSIRIDYKPELTLLSIRDISMDLEKAENSIRIYMVTNDTADLRTYYSVIATIDNKVTSLRNEWSQDSVFKQQVDTISKLIEENIYIWNELLYINHNDNVIENLKQLSDKLNDARENEKQEGGILKRVFSRNKRNQVSRQEFIDDIEKVEQESRLAREKMMTREYQLATTGSKIKERFYDLITQMEQEISGRIRTKAEAADLLAERTYKLLAMFSVSGTLLAIMVLFIVVRYVRKSIAYQKALQHSKEETEKLARTKELFMANMSHEIRTPLTAISGFTEQLSHSAVDEKQARKIHIIQSATDHLTRIINDILDFSRLQSDKIVLEQVHFRIRDILEDVYVLFERKAEDNYSELSYSLDEDIPEVLLGDPFRLKQIMINLVSNAVKFTRNGLVQYKVSSGDRTGSDIELILEFRDTGIGIDKEHLPYIFEDFTQGEISTSRKYGGTGLGLSIVKKLVDLHGGTMNFESEKNKGTQITCRLPFKTGDVKKIQQEIRSGEGVPREIQKLRKVLVVDDENYNRLLFKTILERAGIEYHEASEGTEALRKIRKEPFDLLFMDIRMPGIDGLKVTAFIRNELKIDKSRMPVICISAASVKKEWKKYEHAGMNAFLPKPFTEKMLWETILSVIREAKSETESPDPGTEAKQTIHSDSVNLENLYHIAGGDTAFVMKMLDTFLDTTGKGIDELKDAVERERWEDAGYLAHKLLPPCRHIGATELCKSLEEIKQLTQNGVVPERVKELVDRSSDAFRKLGLALKDHMEHMK